jgi:radical SAM superfamily enzyme with C-terminal helix-hairpin-helix motif
MVEMELSRGCDRCDGRCSFCTEGSGISYEERPLEHVIEEARALNRWGAKAFRFGRCANILAYGGSFTASGGRRPSPEILQTLYREFRQVCPDLEVLHTDNANPASIVSFPDAAAEAIAAIAANNTEGDVLSLGLESLSERVRGRTISRLMKRVLSWPCVSSTKQGVPETSRGLPALLPGLNFLVGLAEERDEDLEPISVSCDGFSTVPMRYAHQHPKGMVFPGTKLSELLRHSPHIHERAFRRWKEWVRTEVDPLMLMRVAPQGTILRNVRIEERLGHVDSAEARKLSALGGNRLRRRETG